jgi:hypothetical protein
VIQTALDSRNTHEGEYATATRIGIKRTNTETRGLCIHREHTQPRGKKRRVDKEEEQELVEIEEAR